MEAEQAFSTDLAVLRGPAPRALPSVAGVTVDEACRDLAARHGFRTGRCPLTWAAVNGRVEAVQQLLELGADPNARGSFGGPEHGAGVTALHLAAQAGRRESVEVLLAAGADRSAADVLYGGTPAGWAEFGGHLELAEELQSRS